METQENLIGFLRNLFVFYSNQTKRSSSGVEDDVESMLCRYKRGSILFFYTVGKKVAHLPTATQFISALEIVSRFDTSETNEVVLRRRQALRDIVLEGSRRLGELPSLQRREESFEELFIHELFPAIQFWKKAVEEVRERLTIPAQASRLFVLDHLERELKELWIVFGEHQS